MQEPQAQPEVQAPQQAAPVDPSFSQRGEDLIIRRLLAGKPEIAQENRRFLDIGAADGKTFSNTRILAIAGWKGVLVEASGLTMKALIELYFDDPEMVIVNAAIGLADIPLIPFHTSPDLVSSLDSQHRDKWASAAPFRTVHQPMVSLDSLIAFIMRHGTSYPVVSIDVEGQSVELFKRLPQDVLNVVVAVVEYDDKLDDLTAYARGMGYDVAEQTAENAILVRRA